eukprot:COSAG02_NODE_9278_length_2269_cov_1.312903_1_plen_99_part_00
MNFQSIALSCLFAVSGSNVVPIPDDWGLAGAPRMRGFNGQAGGRGSFQYLIGFDAEFVARAQSHIPDFAVKKREPRKSTLHKTKIRNRERRSKQRKTE